MTHLYDDPASFTDDMLAGFLDAYRPYVAGVRGGVVRTCQTRPGKVAVVIGGGSGHYPAFCGLVGAGFADGAVVGNIFTSPSADDAYTVAKAVDGGGGILFSTGNYAGDVMNFNLAQDRLRREGIDVRNVYVTDDVASAPAEEVERRRGIAGDFVAFKIAGAAAENGLNLDEVERLARTANDRTRTMGVGLDGCTIPGADDALFHVPPGKMGVGLGIHGEPGISEEPLPRAADLAALLVERVLAEAPLDGDRRVGAILNGLGATKYEELFVVWKTVARLLGEAGYAVVDPEVGELVTSLDMAGISLTLVFLNEELEELWCAPADTPAFRKGWPHEYQAGQQRAEAGLELPVVSILAGSRESTKAAAVAMEALEAMSRALVSAETELGRIDAIAGDGDHGRGMVKGITSAVAAARPVLQGGGGIGAVLGAGGDAWASKAGGTSGVLWGSSLRALGESLGDEAAVGPQEVARALRAFLDTLTSLGKAKVGDKTMVDALVPFVEAFEAQIDARRSLAEAWQEASEVAQRAADETALLRPRVGRARPLAERSLGSPDAGAVSLALCVQVVGRVLSDQSDRERR